MMIRAILVTIILTALMISTIRAQEIRPHIVPDLTFQDAIDILTDYDIVHDSDRSVAFGYYGWTDRQRHIIHIVDFGDHAEKRDTVIHEMLHVKCAAVYEPCTEEEVAAQATTITARLFAK